MEIIMGKLHSHESHAIEWFAVYVLSMLTNYFVIPYVTVCTITRMYILVVVLTLMNYITG